MTSNVGAKTPFQFKIVGSIFSLIIYAVLAVLSKEDISEKGGSPANCVILDNWAFENLYQLLNHYKIYKPLKLVY